MLVLFTLPLSGCLVFGKIVIQDFPVLTNPGAELFLELPALREEQLLALELQREHLF